MTISRRSLRVTLLLVLTLTNPSAAQRQRLSMDPAWRFALGDHQGAEAPAFDDARWRRLDLPHDWSSEGTPNRDGPGGGRIGYFPAGIGWYRKAFRIPAGTRGREAWLEFDGVYMNSDVWINGFRLGKRPYGFISFAYDITKRVVPGVNVIAVRVDNSLQPNSRWYTGSGICRHVWLALVDPLHVGHWGVYVTTPRVDSGSADVVVRTQVENDQTVARKASFAPWSAMALAGTSRAPKRRSRCPPGSARRSSSTSRRSHRGFGRWRPPISTSSGRRCSSAGGPPMPRRRPSASARLRTTRTAASC